MTSAARTPEDSSPSLLTNSRGVAAQVVLEEVLPVARDELQPGEEGHGQLTVGRVAAGAGRVPSYEQDFAQPLQVPGRLCDGHVQPLGDVGELHVLLPQSQHDVDPLRGTELEEELAQVLYRQVPYQRILKF